MNILTTGKDLLVNIVTTPLELISDVAGQLLTHVATNAPAVIDGAVVAVNTLTGSGAA